MAECHPALSTRLLADPQTPPLCGQSTKCEVGFDIAKLIKVKPRMRRLVFHLIKRFSAEPACLP